MAAQGEPPEFTETPGSVYVGDSPAVDPTGRGGLWDSTMLAFLGEMQALESNDSPLPEAQPIAGGGESFGGGGSTNFGGEAGGGEGGPPGDPSGGATWPWEAYGPGGGSEGAPGSVSTQSGNRLTTMSLLAWPSKGDMGVGLTLYHNSRNEGLYSFGYSWRTNYDVTIYQSSIFVPGTNQLTAIVQWPDGRYIPYQQRPLNSTQYDSPYGIYDKLERITGGWQITRRKTHEVWIFNSRGYLIAQKDKNGNQITINRVGANYRIASVTDPSGRSLTFAAGSNGRISSCTDHTGRTWTFSYNSLLNMTAVSSPALNGNTYSRQFGYNTGHNITTETDLRGKIWRCAYDSSHRLTWFKDPLLNQTSYTYGASYTQWTLPLGQSYRHNYSTGMLASSVDPAGFHTAFRYDSYRNKIRVTDPGGVNIVSTFDLRGNILTKAIGGNTTYYTYDTRDNVKTVSAPSATQYKTTFNYDSRSNLTSIVDYLSRNQAILTYDSIGQLLSIQDAVSRTSSYTYNANGDMATSTQEGGTTTFSYDSLGRLVSETSPAGNATSYGFDAWDRLISVTEPGSATVSIDVDLEDNVTATHDELNRTHTFAFDDAGRLTDSTNPRGDHEIYFYDSNSRIFKIRNGRGYDINLYFTSRGELWKQVQPDSTTEYFSYSARGQLGRYTNGLGQAINYHNGIHGPDDVPLLVETS